MTIQSLCTLLKPHPSPFREKRAMHWACLVTVPFASQIGFRMIITITILSQLNSFPKVTPEGHESWQGDP